MAMMIELRGDPVSRKHAKTVGSDVLYWVGAKESFWKPAGIYKFINLLGDPTSPRYYRVAQIALSILMDVISVLPVTFMLYRAGYVDAVQALIIPLIYLTLPHLNSVEIRFESFGQRTVGPVLFQFFLLSLWLINSEGDIQAEVLALLTWYFFIHASYKTSLFGFQLAVFSAIIYALLSMTAQPLLALLFFVMFMYVTSPHEFKSFLNDRVLHTRAQWAFRRSDSGGLCGSSALVDSFYGVLRLGLAGLFGSKSNSSVSEERATVPLRPKLSNFLKRVVFNKNDELIRILISNSVFIIPLLVMYFMGVPSGISEGRWASMVSDVRGIWGDAVTGVYVSSVIVTALVLFIPRLVAFGEASRYLNHCLPQTLAIFLVVANINSMDEASGFALAGLLFLSIFLSVFKFIFYEKKVAGRSGVDTKENIKSIFRKPPKKISLPELDSLESFIREMRISEGGQEFRLMALPLKNNSSFLIADYIIAKQLHRPTNVKVYSMWRDSSIFKSDSHYHGNIYLPMPMSFGPLRLSDIVVVERAYNSLYQGWLVENGYLAVHSDSRYLYHMKAR